MKTILKEIEFASDFCFNCKNYDYYNSPEYLESKKKPFSLEPVKLNYSRLLEGIVGEDDSEETQKKKTEVEEMLEFISWKPSLICPRLQEAKINIDLDRELEMPTNEKEALRYLDRMSNLCFAECPFSRTHLTSLNKSVKGRAIITLAKLDFALLEQGINMTDLNNVVDLYYYDRAEHIHHCGYSYSLINHYIKRYDFEPISRSFWEEVLDIPAGAYAKVSKIPEIFRTPEACDLFNRLVIAGYCTDSFNWIDKSQKVIMSQFAHIIGGLLNIPDNRKWKPFEDLWEVERLAQSFSKRNGRALDAEILKLYPEYKGV